MSVRMFSYYPDYWKLPKDAPQGEFQTQYVGKVLAIVKGRSIQLMSDVYGLCDEVLVQQDDGMFKWVNFRTYGDSCCTGPGLQNSAEVDATPEVYNAYYDSLVKRYDLEELNRLEKKASEIRKHVTVEVLFGRKHKGLVGPAVVMIERPYNMGYRSSLEYKLAIPLSDDKVQVFRNGRVYENYKDLAWVWARNCRVKNPKVEGSHVAMATLIAKSKAAAEVARL